jgi:hypothetical protein
LEFRPLRVIRRAFDLRLIVVLKSKLSHLSMTALSRWHTQDHLLSTVIFQILVSTLSLLLRFGNICSGQHSNYFNKLYLVGEGLRIRQTDIAFQIQKIQEKFKKMYFISSIMTVTVTSLLHLCCPWESNLFYEFQSVFQK